MSYFFFLLAVAGALALLAILLLAVRPRFSTGLRLAALGVAYWLIVGASGLLTASALLVLALLLGL